MHKPSSLTSLLLQDWRFNNQPLQLSADREFVATVGSLELLASPKSDKDILACFSNPEVDIEMQVNAPAGPQDVLLTDPQSTTLPDSPISDKGIPWSCSEHKGDDTEDADAPIGPVLGLELMLAFSAPGFDHEVENAREFIAPTGPQQLLALQNTEKSTSIRTLPSSFDAEVNGAENAAEA